MREVSGSRVGYHHGDLRNALVGAATELARSGGPEAVVLREAARRVGVSPTAAYRHFANQADLLQAVKAEGQRRLAASMEEHVAESGRDLADRRQAARARLRALGLGYLHFATAEPGLYRTAFCRVPGELWPHTAAERAEDADDSFRSFELLVEVLDALEAAGALRPGIRDGAEFAAWSAVHGLAMLILDGPLAELPKEQREVAVERTLTMALDGLTG